MARPSTGVSSRRSVKRFLLKLSTSGLLPDDLPDVSFLDAGKKPAGLRVVVKDRMFPLCSHRLREELANGMDRPDHSPNPHTFLTCVHSFSEKAGVLWPQGMHR
jgi:hypothetical protein